MSNWFYKTRQLLLSPSVFLSIISNSHTGKNLHQAILGNTDEKICIQLQYDII